MLTLQDGRFWPARLNSTPLPDIFGVVVEGQRGNRPNIMARDDILNQAVRYMNFFSKFCSLDKTSLKYHQILYIIQIYILFCRFWTWSPIVENSCQLELGFAFIGAMQLAIVCFREPLILWMGFGQRQVEWFKLF